MKRRLAREYVLQFLFQREFRGKNNSKNDLKQFLSDEKDDAVKKFVERLVRGTINSLDEIDAVIKSAAEHWMLQRIAAVDRNILRSAVYELLHCADIPPAVTINESIEIAKKYSTLESAAFINGILDKIAKQAPAKQTAR